MRLFCNQLPKQLRSAAFGVVDALVARFCIDHAILSLEALLAQARACYPQHACWKQTITIPACSSTNYACLASALLSDFPELYWAALRPSYVGRNVVAIEVDAELDIGEMQTLQDFLAALRIDKLADLAYTRFQYADNKNPASLCCSGRGDCLAVARLVKLAMDRKKTPSLIVKTSDQLHCLNYVLVGERFVFFDYYLFQKTGSFGTSQPALELCFDTGETFTTEQALAVINTDELQHDGDVEKAISELGGSYERVLTFRCLQHLGQQELEQICRRIARAKRYAVAYRVAVLSASDEEVTARIMQVKL